MPGAPTAASLPARLAESPGAIKYASTTGNDSTGDGSFGNPWATLSKLMSTLTAGQVGRLRGGTYGSGLTAGLTWSTIANAANPITIENEPGETVTILQRIAISGQYLRLRGNSGVGVFDREMIVGLNNMGGVGDTNIWVRGNAAHIELFGLEVKDAHFQGLLAGVGGSGGTIPDTVHIYNCFLHDNGTRTSPADHNIYFGSGSVNNGLIANCILARPWNRNCQLYDDANSTIVSCITAVDAGQNGAGVRSGLHVAGGAGSQHSDNCTVINSIFKDNPDYGVRSQWDATPGTGNSCDYCCAHGSTTNFTSSFGGLTLGGNNLTVDPQLVDKVNDDYHLLDTSPCIDAGDPAYTPLFDFEMNDRVTSDLGALAYLPASSGGGAPAWRRMRPRLTLAL